MTSLLGQPQKKLADLTDEELANRVLRSPALDSMEPTCVELAKRVLKLSTDQELRNAVDSQQTHAMRMEFFEGFTTAMNRHLVCPLNASETRKVLEACYAFIRANYAQLLEDVDGDRYTWRDAGAAYYETRNTHAMPLSDSTYDVKK